MIKVAGTSLDGVLKIQLDIFTDHRGQYIETYNEKIYQEHGIIKFVCDDVSMSIRSALRGIHGDSETWKLISCLHGLIYVVVVNCDGDSKDFGKWESFVLAENSGLQVLIPPKYGVAHLVMSERAIFHYKQSTYYDRGKQFTYRYDDERFGIWWPIKNPILSRRDEEAHYV